jgi:hypothetical protein
MGNDSRRRLFRAGEVVYFHHLHTRHDLIRHDPRPDGDGRSWCRVEGKPRPMLVLRRCRRLLVDTATSTGEPSGTNQCVWYRVETRATGAVPVLPQLGRGREGQLCGARSLVLPRRERLPRPEPTRSFSRESRV